LRRRERGQEVAHRALAVVGDEVRLAAATAIERQGDRVRHVVHVGGRRPGAAAIEPCPSTVTHHPRDRRQDGPVARSPHEARPERQRVEVERTCGEHAPLCFGLGLAVEITLEVGVRRVLGDVDQIVAVEERRLGADVDEASHAGIACGGEHAGRALHVAAPELLVCAPLLDEGGGMHQRVAPRDMFAFDVLEIGLDRRRAEALHRGGGAWRAGHGQHLVVTREALDDVTADEARPTGDEHPHAVGRGR
jgi:hypothetical protein